MLHSSQLSHMYSELNVEWSHQLYFGIINVVQNTLFSECGTI